MRGARGLWCHQEGDKEVTRGRTVPAGRWCPLGGLRGGLGVPLTPQPGVQGLELLRDLLHLPLGVGFGDREGTQVTPPYRVPDTPSSLSRSPKLLQPLLGGVCNYRFPLIIDNDIKLAPVC